MTHYPATPEIYWAGRLTPTQAAVAELVSQGVVNKVIADRLGMSVQTLKFHVHGCFSRLGLTNRVELTRWWIERVELAEAVQHAGRPTAQRSGVCGKNSRTCARERPGVAGKGAGRALCVGGQRLSRAGRAGSGARHHPAPS